MCVRVCMYKQDKTSCMSAAFLFVCRETVSEKLLGFNKKDTDGSCLKLVFFHRLLLLLHPKTPCSHLSVSVQGKCI